MSTFQREQREAAENLTDKKAELYHEHLEAVKQQEDIRECEDLLKTYMGIDEFKKLSKNNFDMILGAMQEYAENITNR